MSDDSSQLVHFLVTVRRRWILWRTLERIGICVAIACGIATVLAMMLLAQGQSAMGFILVCLGVGAVCGAIVGWLHRPTLIEAAVEVDRQLKLSELLTTALSVRQSRTVIADPFDKTWAGAILAIADSRCNSLAYEPLLLRKFGVRAWGGIGLCASLVLAAGALSTNPLILQASFIGSSPQASGRLNSGQQPLPAYSAGSSPRPAIPSCDPESMQHSRAEAPQAPDSRNASGTSGSNDRSNSALAGDRSGSASARTNQPRISSRSLSGTTDTISSSQGDMASGGGRSSEAAPDGTAADGSAGHSLDTATAAPWTSPDWPDAQNRASRSVDSGAIPDTYRALVRDYFNPGSK